MKDTGSIVKFHRKVQFNIGIIITLFILAYVVFHIFTYLTRSSIKVYEVIEGAITQDNYYRAVALRKENLVNSEYDGTCIYFAEDRTRAGVKSMVCAVDSSGDIARTLTANNSSYTLSKADLKDAVNTVSTFTAAFSPDSFQELYPFKNSLSENLSTAYGKRAATENSELIAAAEAVGSFHTYYAPYPGLLVMSSDGLEGLSEDKLTTDILKGSEYKSTVFGTAREIKSGEPLYRIITDDDWKIAMQITEETAREIQNESYLSVRFQSDGCDVTGAVELTSVNEKPVLILTFDDSMDRYADYRYLYVTLLLDEKRGLKIPNSAIVKKNFFAIPKDYFVKGGDSNDLGVIVRSKTGTPVFVKPTVYYEDDTYSYTDSEKLESGEQLLKADSKETFAIGSKVDEKEGVYNVNKGYAVFKLINKLFSNEDYSIVESGTDYGIQLYDHIALDGSRLKDGNIIF